MLKTVKVAVSMSSEDFKVIEDIRKHDGITRSGVVVKGCQTSQE